MNERGEECIMGMTRKETKMKAFDILHFVADNAGLSTFEAIEKAYNIGVSEQESCEDAISRKAVLQMIEDIQDAGGFIGCNIYSEAFDMVDNMPPVTPTCKKGKWINGDPICPCCGEDKFKDLDADIWADWQPKYCPNCGAKMVESEAKNDRNI